LLGSKIALGLGDAVMKKGFAGFLILGTAIAVYVAPVELSKNQVGVINLAVLIVSMAVAVMHSSAAVKKL
jgi:hypothetical protein